MTLFVVALLFSLSAQTSEPSDQPKQPQACGAAVAGMKCVAGGVVVVGTNDQHKCGQGENRSNKTSFGPAFERFVDTVYVDETEVTNAQYQACVKEKRCKPSTPNYSDFRRPEQPATAMSWFLARDFCVAQGKRLLTEAEWEHAAAIDTAVPDCPAVVVMNDKGRSCGVPMKGAHADKGRVLEVKNAPANAYGLYEMRGNAEEWVDDWFVKQRSKDTADGPCPGKDSCATATLKMVKGGSWYWPAEDAQSWHRRPWTPTNRPAHHFGFRCGASVDAAQKLAVPPPTAPTP